MARAHALHNASSASTWLDCGLHIHYKKAAEAAGEVIDTSSAASVRGNLLHDICEHVLPKLIAARSATEGQLVLSSEIEAARGQLQAQERYAEVAWGDDEIEHTEMALNTAMDLILQHQAVSVGVEVGCELSHEPGETGKVDVLVLGKEAILVIDYKFGQGEVPIDTPQLKIYAANAIDKLWPRLVTMEPRPNIVKRIIIQPALFREPIVDYNNQTFADMKRFQAFVDHTAEAQRDGKDIRGASDLSTCKWCPFKDRCTHRPQLVGGMMQLAEDVREDHPLRKELIERLVRMSAEIANVVKEAKQEIIDNPDTFPDWIRAKVSNGSGWSDLISQDDIISELINAGVEDPYNLKTPSQIRDGSGKDPDVLKVLDGLTIDKGHHIRLRPAKAAPKDVVEQPKRPDAKSTPPPAPATKPKPKAKKPAAKKAAKKTPAKKKGKKTATTRKKTAAKKSN